MVLDLPGVKIGPVESERSIQCDQSLVDHRWGKRYTEVLQDQRCVCEQRHYCKPISERAAFPNR
jgi:hypothetical protein